MLLNSVPFCAFLGDLVVFLMFFFKRCFWVILVVPYLCPYILAPSFCGDSSYTSACCKGEKVKRVGLKAELAFLTSSTCSGRVSGT